MITSGTNCQQDTLKVKALLKDTIRFKADTLHKAVPGRTSDSLKPVRRTAQMAPLQVFTDTTTVCTRNIISDVTFYDSTNFIRLLEPLSVNRFPYKFTETNREKEFKAKSILVRHLKSGEEIPEQPLHGDWIILVILISAFMFSLVKSVSKSFIPDVTRFFLFRGINDPSSRDIGGLFLWQSTILNLISFGVIALFFSLFASFYDIIPAGVSVFSAWLVSLGIIIGAVTIRHIVCLITGNISESRDVFREYLIGVYQSYRFGSLILFIVIVLLSYSILAPVKSFFFIGLFSLAIMYLIRVIRLFVIFINRNISIFYLILYLCALEILPVVISVKFFTGLV
jgi:hypothetical protein